ncbi:2-keto-4-pentenoate hydratase [Penicillium waksmanii]|uniref:2-keto-4-pentenoate hydratase n=1 Tax=Penicillium waksmanii TaxID=69791 RepID=UPI00254846CB|nr:2-keto-4-pentenoate hydratase [Penicillium waksmanii]KAJ5976214.1 2-keto-4-pentenoate hydratase [Penicillium waksmanii]
MPSWTHLIRFIAVEDSLVHLGQLVDTSRDIGKDSTNGVQIAAYVIQGTIYDGRVTGEIMHVKQASLLSPVAREECNYIRCLGLNYMDHAQEANMALPKAPILFTKPRSALIGPYPAAINIPKCAQDETSDYEAELCLVIGKTGRDIPEEDALDYVLGYTASNDVSARTMQMITTQWSFSKGLDGSCPIGPVLVAPSVIQDPQGLSIKAIHNGNTVQDGHTKDMIFSIKKQISYLSQGTTLEAGTIFLTGTPAGIGYFWDPRVVLRDGDEISVQIEQIGTLVNLVRYESH